MFFGHGVKESSRVLEKWGMTNAYPFTVVLGLALVLCAVGILLGFLTRFAIIGAVAEAGYGYFLMTGGHYDLTTSSAQMTCLVVVSLLALMVLGAGRVSTDAVLNTRAEQAVTQN
ncbi:MAG: TQO small subunit DoxD [Lawsonella clevelandensis]